MTTRYFLIKTTNDELKELYKNSDHHHKGDAGFDLYVPQNYIITSCRKPKDRVSGDMGVVCAGPAAKIHLDIKCEAYDLVDHNKQKKPLSFMLMPRSSIGKTSLRLSNSIGLIDSSYRGELIALVDNITDNPCHIEKGTRLFQIVFADLQPADKIVILNDDEELSETTRGEGGFGSTGST